MLTVVAAASVPAGDRRRRLTDDGWARLGRGWLWTGPTAPPLAAWAVALVAEAEAAPRLDPAPGPRIPRPPKPAGPDQPSLVIGGNLALQLLGCELVPHELPTLLVTPPGTSGMRRTSAVRQRAPLAATEWVVRDPVGVTAVTTLTGRQPLPWLTVTSPARSAQDCVRRLGGSGLDLRGARPRDLKQGGPLLAQVQLLWVLEQLLRRHQVDLTAGASRRVRRTLAPLVEQADPGSRSPLETAVRRLLVDGGCPAPVCNVKVLPKVVCDLVWLAERVVVECDGKAWHSAPSAVAKDARRHGLLPRAGWTVIRVTWDDLVKDPQALVAEIRAALRLDR